MATIRRSAAFDRRFARHLGHLIRIYWTTPDARWGAVLLATAAVLEIATVAGSVLVADAERRILDGLEHRDVPAFLAAVGLFFAATLGFVFASAYRIYTRQGVEIRWRRALTAHYVGRWMSPRCYLMSELHGAEVDNPQQRIQEDIRDFVASALGLSLSLLAAVATLVSFGGFLYRLSAPWPVVASGAVYLPGIMLWVALGYAALSMWVTHLVGRRLVPINYDRLRFEADFRYGLVHFRDNAATVTLTDGEQVEQAAALRSFRHVIANFWQLVRAQRDLTLLTGGLGQANAAVPVLIAAPAYFAQLITIGSVVQIRIAYGQISAALSWFVFAYQEIARWRANVERLATFSESLDATERDFAAGGITVVRGDADTLRLTNLHIVEPDGRGLLSDASAVIHAGDRVVITGASGTGKTLLVRTIAGIWPFGTGRVEVPAGARMLFVSQWPYIPIGTLRGVLCYPLPEGEYSDGAMAEALGTFGLKRLASRLDDVEAWERILSPHETQSLAMARVLLQRPDWLFLDKATSALDEATERDVYEVLAARLPRTTIVTIAHRPAVAQYHTHRWTLSAASGRVTLAAA